MWRRCGLRGLSAASRFGAALAPPSSSLQAASATRLAAAAFPTRTAPTLSALRAFSSIIYPPPAARVAQPAPDFNVAAVVDGEIETVSLSQFLGKWVILFWYPKDFTFVCPTEILAFADRAAEFEAANCVLLGASTDTAETHLAWLRTPRRQGGLGGANIRLLADVTKEVAASYGVLSPGGVAFRGLFLVDPRGVLQATTVNNMPVGRSVDEALRTLRAFQFVEEHGEVCPAGWTPGAATMQPSTDGAATYFSALDEGADPLAAVRPIASEQQLDAELAASPRVVVDWHAPWCGKCRQIAPAVSALQSEHPDVTFLKVDTDAHPALAATHGATVLPTFTFYRHGKEVPGSKLHGYKKKPLADAVAALAKA